MKKNYIIDTIAAIATAPGRSSIGIIRISGIHTIKVANSILKKIPYPRTAEYLSFFKENTILDKGIAIFFPNPNSFTGEDILELHCHGGPTILNIFLQHIVSFKNIRLANPGEFSERAFLNKKIDLIQAEAIDDLINANSDVAVIAAMNSIRGIFSEQINNISNKIIKLRTYIEGIIEFPDDIDDITLSKIEQDIDNLINILNNIKNQACKNNFLREGMKVVIAGEPNVGKSTLMNKLVQKEVAIVSSIAGTTRDVIRENIYIDGIPICIMDTAGLRISNEIIENIGIKLAISMINKADHVFMLIDSTKTTINNSMPEFIKNKLKKEISNFNVPITVIRNKADLTNEPIGYNYSKNNDAIITISAHSGKGLDILCKHIKNIIGFSGNSETYFMAKHRHLESINKSKEYLLSAKQNLHYELFDLLSEDLKLSHMTLMEIIGTFNNKDLLNKIFLIFV